MRQEIDIEKESEWDRNELVVSVDMQKVTMLPRIPDLFCCLMNRLILLEDQQMSQAHT